MLSLLSLIHSTNIYKAPSRHGEHVSKQNKLEKPAVVELTFWKERQTTIQISMLFNIFDDKSALKKKRKQKRGMRYLSCGGGFPFSARWSRKASLGRLR